MPTRMTRLGAIASLALSLAAGVALALYPCAYQGIVAESPAPGTGEPEQVRRVCASLIQAEGVAVLALLALPVLFAIIGLVAVRTGRRTVLLAMVFASLVFCLVGTASIGLFYIPAALALALAAIGWRRDPGAASAADR
jgi:hypothetical protein